MTTRQRYFVQPAVVDCIIFWATILIGVAIAVIVQMEIIGYGPISWWALAILLVVLAVARLQLSRTRLIITPERIRFLRLIPSDNLTLAPDDITGVQASGHRLRVATRQYGVVHLVAWRNPSRLVAALTQAKEKGSPNV